jgi:carbon starvation protein CstA
MASAHVYVRVHTKAFKAFITSHIIIYYKLVASFLPLDQLLLQGQKTTL